MDCPRCKLTLRETDYEGVKVDMCDSCWGFWLDRGELRDVTDTRDLNFSEEERRAFTAALGTSATLETTEAAACPLCGRAMEQVYAEAGIRLVIDRCSEHGIWLDAGEIKAVQVTAERSAEFHRLLLGKLGLGEH